MLHAFWASPGKGLYPLPCFTHPSTRQPGRGTRPRLPRLGLMFLADQQQARLNPLTKPRHGTGSRPHHLALATRNSPDGPRLFSRELNELHCLGYPRGRPGVNRSFPTLLWFMGQALSLFNSQSSESGGETGACTPPDKHHITRSVIVVKQVRGTVRTRPSPSGTPTDPAWHRTACSSTPGSPRSDR